MKGTPNDPEKNENVASTDDFHFKETLSPAEKLQFKGI